MSELLKICIINVGANASHGRLRSPIFENGIFEFATGMDRSSAMSLMPA